MYIRYTHTRRTPLFSRYFKCIFFGLLLLLLLLSPFSRVRLCASPKTAAHQAPPSLGFSRQEHWSGLPFPSPGHESEKSKWSRSVISDSWWPHGLQPTRLLRPWDFPGKSTGVGILWPRMSKLEQTNLSYKTMLRSSVLTVKTKLNTGEKSWSF